jgi:ribonucleoside-triphosphate reductase (formate)
MLSFLSPAREYAQGIGDAVADRTINRKLPGGKVERWGDVAKRVATGNALLCSEDFDFEFHQLHKHLRQASLLMSGRHLQHGDDTQPTRPQEVFTNCSTSTTSFLTFYLLLNGSGVGRAYDNNMMVANWSHMPIVVPVIDSHHKDVQSGEITFQDRRTAEHLYAGRKQVYFRVPDSREGWAKAVEKLEIMAWRCEHDSVLIIDFSDVRPRGSPILGMQNRPASGPCPLMVAFANVARLRDAGMQPWRAAMYADHYFAECVLVGGARRAARMSTKTWRDESVLDFIQVKRGGFLWSSNNSVTVDEEFWKLVRTPLSEIRKTENHLTVQLAKHAKCVFEAICDAAYHDGTGEPGFINQDKLTVNNEGITDLTNGRFAGSKRYQLEEETLALTKDIVWAFNRSRYTMITNPCGEVALSMLGGYCVIADVVPHHSRPEFVDNLGKGEVFEVKWDDDAEEAFRVATRALIRTNTMDALYAAEVKRTNRIGVGMTGLHEYAWSRFGFGWKDLVDEQKSISFWRTLGRFSNACVEEADAYSDKLGVVRPHTVTTIKPAGTTSKLFGLTEGAHLPSMREYLRWVQFRNDDPLVETYKAKGYPVRKLKTYNGTTIVGFPTKPEICKLGMDEKLVTAGEATPAEQFEWLRLLEKWWIDGYDEKRGSGHGRGNQVSYTLKYKHAEVGYEAFKQIIMDHQSMVRCCSVMPQGDTSAYEYLPETPVTKHEFDLIAEAIQDENVKEDVGLEHVDCAGGACPISFGENDASVA